MATPPLPTSAISNRAIFTTLIFLFCLIFSYAFFLTPPSNFPRGGVVTINEGSSVAEVATLLAEKQVVRFPKVFEYLIRFRSLGASSSKATVVVAGDYAFPQPEDAIAIAERVARGEYDISPIKLTVPEGANTFDIAALLAKLIPGFDVKDFIARAQPREGYLFPDTYYFQPTWDSERMIRTMEKQFLVATKPLASLIDKSGRMQEQIVIMASLLEREARTLESRRMIAGILWKRLDEGMPLQVDATFTYFTNKSTYELSLKDLATSSPYNTYRYRGLPIGPIANPGLDALTATLTPIESDYWFYLSDRTGNLHYAVDFNQHKRNKALYLP